APGTAGAIALGVAHVLVRDGHFDRDFVHDHADNFQAFAASLVDYTPDKVEAITGAPARTIERLASEMAATRPAFAIADERSPAYSNGLATARAVIALDALVGAVGRDEGGLVIEPAPPFAAWPAVVPDAIAAAGVAKPRLDGAGTAAYPWS